jgi:hypothetical protein
MIVKDCEGKLRRCLESVKGGVDAIVVLDTGSQDGTMAVARAFGARVEEMPWPGAFDLARNASLDLAETEWTLWLDADEWLVPGAASLLRKAIGRDDAFGYHLVRKDLYPDGRTGEQALLRLWRTTPDLRLVGAIHEHFTDEDLTRACGERKLFLSDIEILHDGYDAEVSEDKLRRNLPLLRRELELRPNGLYYEIELANTLERLGDPEGRSLLDAIAGRLIGMQDRDEAPDAMSAVFLASYLPSLQESDLRGPRADALARLCRGWFPESPVVVSAVSQLEIRRGNLQAALRDLLELERMAETGRYDKFTSVPPGVLQESLFTNLALVAHQLGRLDVAERNYKRLLQIDPSNSTAQNNLRLLQGSPR